MIDINSPRKTENSVDHLILKASKGFSCTNYINLDNIPNNIVLTTYPGIGIIYFL